MRLPGEVTFLARKESSYGVKCIWAGCGNRAIVWRGLAKDNMNSGELLVPTVSSNNIPLS